MPQHAVHPSSQGRGHGLDVQADDIQGFETRLVVPLLPLEDAPRVGRDLNPVFGIGGVPHMMATQYAAAVRSSVPRAPTLSLHGHRDAITRALDLLLHGF